MRREMKVAEMISHESRFLSRLSFVFACIGIAFVLPATVTEREFPLYAFSSISLIVLSAAIAAVSRQERLSRIVLIVAVIYLTSASLLYITWYLVVKSSGV
jgi:hypothetical protein